MVELEDDFLPKALTILKNQKTFCYIFIAFLESSLNFEHFEKKNKNKKNGSHSLSISEITDFERRGYLYA